MSGNVAVSEGWCEGGVKIAGACPGTISTEILQNIQMWYKNTYAGWSPNDKFAFEVAKGGSAAQSRLAVGMSHVGVNAGAFLSVRQLEVDYMRREG